MIDPLPDARLRDDVAQQIFTQAMGRLEDMGNFDAANRRAVFGHAATTSTAPTAPPSMLSLEKIQAMLDAVGPEPLGEWMREQGFPPEASLLILPETMRSQLPFWPSYVRISVDVSAPTLMRDVLADHQVWERCRK